MRIRGNLYPLYGRKMGQMVITGVDEMGDVVLEKTRDAGKIKMKKKAAPVTRNWFTSAKYIYRN